jgi:hypothetical protein
LSAGIGFWRFPKHALLIIVGFFSHELFPFVMIARLGNDILLDWVGPLGGYLFVFFRVFWFEGLKSIALY